MDAQSLTAIKVAYKGEIHRIRVDLTTFKYEDLKNLFETTFSLAPESYVIQYKDQESDHVNVKSATDFEEACAFFAASSDAVKSLRFVAVPATHVAFHENVAEPLLKVIEQLVQTLNEAMEKVKQDQWAAKAQENARVFATKAHEAINTTGVVVNEKLSHTGEVLSETFAKSSVVVNEKLAEAGAAIGPIANKTIEESKAAFEAAKKSLNEIEFDKIKQSINEIEFDRIMKEATEGVKSAAVVATNYATNLVNELQKLQQVNAIPVVDSVEVAVAAPAPVAEEVAVVVESVPEVAAEAEWEQIPEATVAPTPSPEELKWAAQLTLIREVFPTADASAAITLLENSNGDVHVVLNQLAEL